MVDQSSEQGGASSVPGQADAVPADPTQNEEYKENILDTIGDHGQEGVDSIYIQRHLEKKYKVKMEGDHLEELLKELKEEERVTSQVRFTSTWVGGASIIYKLKVD